MEEKLSDRDRILGRLAEHGVGPKVPSAPRVSVIIPVYNNAGGIARTLDAVLAQTRADHEIVLVNDGSDDTEELERVLEDYRTRLVYARQDNLGASAARNSALCLARGELIAFLDADDIWYPEYLEKQVGFLEASGADMVYCDADLVGDRFLAGKTYMETTPSSGEVGPVSLLDGTCNVITSGTLVRREWLDRAGLFDQRSKRAQDFELWFRLARRGARIRYQREVLLAYRVSPDSLSGSNIHRAQRNVAVLDLIGEKYELGPEELKVLKRQKEFSAAELELEKGKARLIAGDHVAAGEHFGRANEYYRKPKLTLLRFLLKVSPGLAVRLFRRLRPAEFAFIAARQDDG